MSSSNASVIQQIESVAKTGYDGVLAIANEVKETLAQEKRQNELANLEEEIIVQNDSLVMFIDSMYTNIPINYSNSLKRIKTFANTTLNNYSKVKSAQDKLNAARNTVGCLKNLNELSSTVSQMSEFKSAIQETYTDRIWNPFMATLMDEDIKKRITSAYMKILEPYFLKQIEESLTCENISELNSNITENYHTVLMLKDKDTKKLERKLKKEKDPLAILELLNVQNTKQ